MAAVAAGSPDIEELVKQITIHPGVRGFLVVNSDGIPIRHSFTEASRDLAVQYAALLQSLAIKARGVVQELDNNDELTLVRLRTRNSEVIVAPDNKYLIIVIQEPEGYATSTESSSPA